MISTTNPNVAIADRTSRIAAIKTASACFTSELLAIIELMLPKEQTYVCLSIPSIPGVIKYLYPDGSFSWMGDNYEGRRPTDIRDLGVDALASFAEDLDARTKAIEAAARARQARQDAFCA